MRGSRQRFADRLGRDGLFTKHVLLLSCLALSSCSLPDEYVSGGHLPHIKRPQLDSESPLPEPVVAEPRNSARTSDLGDALSAAPPSTPTNISDSDALDMSDEVVPFEKFARGREEQYRTITEHIDDAVFAQNRDRKKLIEQRALDDNGTDIPDRRSLFGGDRFLSPGPIDPGYNLPTGATWRPYFLAFGSMRSSVQTFNQGPKDITEWANRLDLFGNLYLSGTERILVGFRPFDQEGNFSGYTFGGGTKKQGWNDALNFEPQTLFFEGDFGELFPCLDLQDKGHLDYQFSIGRQPLVLQDGIMLNDSVDAIGITRHNIYMLGASNTRITGLFGLNEVHRGNNIEDSQARLFAISSAFDYPVSTYEVDAAYVSGGAETGGDGAYFGVGRIARFGPWNSTFRANASWALDQKTPAVGTGYLLSHELSRTLPGSSDILYLNTYIGINNYTSAVRGPANGGPLGRMGLLNRAVGLGAYGAALSNKSGDTLGASMGYQHFFDAAAYHQLLVEVGGRAPYGGNKDKRIGALGAQYQWGLGRGLALIVGGFGSMDEEGDSGYGARTEFMVKF